MENLVEPPRELSLIPVVSFKEVRVCLYCRQPQDTQLPIGELLSSLGNLLGHCRADTGIERHIGQ